MKLLATSMGAVHMCLTAFLNFACGHGRSSNDNFQEKKKTLGFVLSYFLVGAFSELFSS